VIHREELRGSQTQSSSDDFISICSNEVDFDCAIHLLNPTDSTSSVAWNSIVDGSSPEYFVIDTARKRLTWLSSVARLLHAYRWSARNHIAKIARLDWFVSHRSGAELLASEIARNSPLCPSGNWP
jgi:hypothetical protein